MSSPVLVAFSHLRWNSVHRRPQQLLSRLARYRPVLFVEEPVQAEGAPRLRAEAGAPGVTVLVPQTPVAAPGFDDEQIAVLEPLLAAHWRRQGLGESVAWLSTPMALPLVDALRPSCLVYDCIDELAARADAPLGLRRREMALLRRAALVFAGGPSLYEAKRALGAHVHCLPNAVDAHHFEPSGLIAGSAPDRQAQALQGTLARPRLGYFGAIDEHIDVALLAALADAHPEWQLVLAGPVVGIDAAVLPRRPNIHWLGAQPYERLPYLLAGWDVCLLPFAHDAGTDLPSPTQALEYMAGERPVVSTPVRDVVLLYGSVVRIADGAAAFLQACEATLAESVRARCGRMMEMLNTVSMHSWDRSAESVQRLIEAALAAAPPARHLPAVAAAGRELATVGGAA